MIDPCLGSVTLTPHGPVVAGSVGQWTLRYTVGSYGVDEGGTLKLAQRFACDWQRPQFDRPAEPAYATVHTDGPAKLRPHFEAKGHERPWMRCLVIDVYDGSLAPGDTVTLTLGDQGHGSPGVRAQTFVESAHEFRLLVDPTNACVARPLPDSPRFPVVAGPATELVCIVPTQGVVGEPVDVFVKGQDAWGNPTPAPDDVELQWQGGGGGGGGGGARFDGQRLILDAPATGHVVARVGDLHCLSNAITIHDTRPRYQRYWGDLHAQTDATVGTGTEREYFTFARDRARVDFASHQGNDFQMTDADWQRLNDVVAEFHEDGHFVVFPGYEWSANTPAGGDRNVFYLEEGMPIIRSSHWQVPDVPEDKLTPAHPAGAFFARMREHVDTDKVLLAAHVGGRYADIQRYFDQELGPLVEVVSCWGIFEWLLHDALDAGYIVGVMCNSDGHKGRPGAEGPGAGEFGIGGGLTCVLAESLSRADIFTALKARRCYGTTGARIDLDFTVAGAPMGSVIPAGQSSGVAARVTGCAPMESLTLYRGREPVQCVRPAAFDGLAGSRRVRVGWGGARIRGRGRRVTWDGHIALAGAGIERVAPHAFDSAADGVRHVDATRVDVISHTTGDTDGVDLWLDDATRGQLTFHSAAGQFEVNLALLDDAGGEHTIDLGGIGMHVSVERYPETLTDHTLSLAGPLPDATSRTDRPTPWYVKAVQADGHAAWSSPIYTH